MQFRIRSALPALFALAALAARPAAAQERAPGAEPMARTSGYVELLGNGLFYTVNLDHRFTERVAGRVGLAAFGGAAVPVMASYLAGDGNHHLEAGAGALFVYIPDTTDVDAELEDIEGTAVLGTATLGYRYQPRGGGFVFRAGFTPIFGAGGVLPWAGISFGFAP